MGDGECDIAGNNIAIRSWSGKTHLFPGWSRSRSLVSMEIHQ